ncbi:MAG: DJ-1/PfpI family protein [Gammaproteobacteria bacterium]|jgi:4-methyl-5(b-hydroxyethyl)-thiazole monophosphate biosynthesis|nr:DJ-1/PfpI family protein [Gammaproteobacteria bacterium]MBT3490284.1 DJ-1/PfpI family protein [Gammaproteobacteria bacterium]MBT3719299.1 DJ-1/PfpI family protein [Gammaproteobacteria bacterium]MBT3845536.1 DJ-1/PfpI family protein [Gammaproteobacteria bacterium]MBT3893358.1 DJ-1/PfpI family protein [Gammaproteobacteria bacterium]
MSQPSVLVPLAEGFEELEAITIIDLLRRAEIEVVVAGLKPGPVRASRKTVHLADMTLDEALQREYEMVVLPGGLPGADHLNADPRIHQLLKKMAAAGRYTAAICAAPKVLADAGLLEGREATCYPGVLQPSQARLIEGVSVVTDGKVVTSRGPGTAMDFALELIALLLGEERREQVEAPLVRQ